MYGTRVCQYVLTTNFCTSVSSHARHSSFRVSSRMQPLIWACSSILGSARQNSSVLTGSAEHARAEGGSERALAAAAAAAIGGREASYSRSVKQLPQSGNSPPPPPPRLPDRVAQSDATTWQLLRTDTGPVTGARVTASSARPCVHQPEVLAGLHTGPSPAAFASVNGIDATFSPNFDDWGK